MIDSSALERGHHYFFLTYADKGLRVPVIETLVYVDSSEELNSRSQETFWSFEIVGRDDGVSRRRIDQPSLSALFDWAGLIEELAQNLESQKAGLQHD